MNSSSDGHRRTRVLHGDAAAAIPAAQLDSRAMPSRSIGTVHIDQRVLDSVTAEARQAGYDDGYQAGIRAADAAVQQAELERWDHLHRAVSALSAGAADFERAQEQAFVELEDALATAAFLLTETLLGRELSVAEHPGRDAIARALRMAPERLPVSVYLHPDDAAVAGDLSTLAPGRTLAVVVDPSIERGGCRLEIGRSEIDAMLGTAVARVQEALSS
jgi:flagellar assembly protein FliH